MTLSAEAELRSPENARYRAITRSSLTESTVSRFPFQYSRVLQSVSEFTSSLSKRCGWWRASSALATFLVQITHWAKFVES